MAIADELIALLGFELTGEDAARRYEARLKSIEKTAEHVGAAIGTGIKVAAAAGAAGLAFLTKSVIDVNAEFEAYQATLETIEGTSEKAKQSMSWIQQFAKTTPYDLAGVTEAFVRLKAYGIDPIADDTLKTLGDTASAMNKPLMQAVEALADAQTGEFERLKEFGIKSKQQGDEVTFSWTKNGQELTKVVKKNATDIRKFLLETMGDRFAGAMDKQSKTWNGMMSNLGDSWTGFLKKVGDSGFFKKVEDRLASLLDTIDRLDKDGTLDKWANNVGKTLLWFADTFWAIGQRIATNIDFLIEHFDKLKPYIIGLGIALGTVIAKAFPFLTFLFFLGLAIDDFVGYLQGSDSVIGDFIEGLKKLMGGDFSGAVKLFEGLSTAVAGLAGATVILGGFSTALWPVAAALAAVAGAFYLAKSALDYFDQLQAKADAKVNSIKAVENPKNKPGYIETDDHTATGGMLYRSGAAIIDKPKEPDIKFTEDALDLKFMLQNLEGNLANMDNNATGAPVINDNKQDNRQFPQTNNVTVNQTVTQATAAPGAAAQATGNAVKGAVASQRSQIESEPSSP